VTECRHRPITSEGVVLTLLRQTPHFLTLPILLNNADPFDGVWDRGGAVDAGVTPCRSSASEVSMGICRVGSTSPSNRLVMGVALTEELNWTGTRVVSELLNAI